MTARNSNTDSTTVGGIEAEIIFRHPDARPLQMGSGIDAQCGLKYSMEPGEGSECADDLAPARGIMLSVLMGLAIWGSIIAFCLG